MALPNSNSDSEPGSGTGLDDAFPPTKTSVTVLNEPLEDEFVTVTVVMGVVEIQPKKFVAEFAANSVEFGSMPLAAIAEMLTPGKG